ncbi:MAG: pseudouridine synthase, partial [Okeania sp. SIO3B3]|nr:pseudouridine synthase [Okeania sp. SIO3B3]
PKTYLAQVEHIPTPNAIDQLQRGVMVKGQKTRPARVQLLTDAPILFPRSVPIRYRKTIPTAWLKLTITEGKKRQVRRMTAAAGYPTLRLVRIAIGPLTLGTLEPGQWRDITRTEYEQLCQSLKLIKTP